MKDMVPLGTGNSRYLKSVENFKTLYPTYDDFVAALVAGTLPVDFNGINLAGIAEVGTALSKTNLLKDATAALFGLGSDAVPDEVLASIRAALDKNTSDIAAMMPKIAIGTYTGTGKYGSSNACSLSFDFTPKFLLVWGKLYGYFCMGIKGQSMTTFMYDSVYEFQAIAMTTTWGTNKVSWYYSSGHSSQMNRDDETYSYIAIG